MNTNPSEYSVIHQLPSRQKRTPRYDVPVIINSSPVRDASQHFHGDRGVVDVAAGLAPSYVLKEREREGEASRVDEDVWKKTDGISEKSRQSRNPKPGLS